MRAQQPPTFLGQKHNKATGGQILAVTDAERVKKPKLPKRRLLKKALRSKGH
jgi:hypothetical protein